LSLSIDLDMLS